MQRKIFRIEHTFAGRRATATPDGDHATAAREALGASVARRGDATRTALGKELAALIGDGCERRLARAAGELGAAVDGMHIAAQKILTAVESIDDGAKALAAAPKTDYERSLAQDIQEQVVQIYEACNFQDLAGQRIGKVIALLGAIEDQLDAMLARCGGDENSRRLAAEPGARSSLLNGPRLDGDGGHASQPDIDRMFG